MIIYVLYFGSPILNSDIVFLDNVKTVWSWIGF